MIQVVVPDAVTAGVPFDVSISVYGSGSCTVVDEVEVDYTAIGATLRPFVITRGGACTADLRRFVAVARMTLSRVGEATINVIGEYGTIANDRHTVRDTTVTRQTMVRSQ